MSKTGWLVLTGLCLLLTVSSAAAWKVEETGWPVEERCVGKATEPPEDWKFPGAILMTGHYGIHAVSADLPTPYVVAFIPYSPRYDAENLNMVLSPDQRWVAVPHATNFNGGLWIELNVYEITVYSTVTPRESYTVPWKATLFGYLYAPRWADNVHLIYPTPGIDDTGGEFVSEETYLINPFTQQSEIYAKLKINPYLENSFFNSPDWTRTVYDARWFDNGIDPTTDWGLYDPGTGNKLATLPLTLKYPSIAWSYDSSQFAALVGEWDQNQQIVLFDRDGKNQEIMFKVNPGFVVDSGYGTQVFGWTNNSRYLVFRLKTKTIPPSAEAYIVDVEYKRVFKTCMDMRNGFASSPDGKLLALIGDEGNSSPVMIFDPENWKLYTVAYHNGTVIGWRGDE